jgi:uncharacterized membrane protein YhhN
MIFPSLSLAALGSGLVTIASDFHQRYTSFYVFKPLTTLLLIALAYALLPVSDSRAPMLFALVFCLAGDIALLWHGKRAFIAGLLAFLLGHLLLVWALVQHPASQAPPPAWWLICLPAVGYIAYLAPRCGRLLPAVVVYVCTILAMVLAAAGAHATPALSGSGLVLTGALSFLLSDSVLAWRRFVQPSAIGQAITLATYYSGLWCLIVGQL